MLFISKANTTSTRDTSVCPAQLPFTWNTKTISSGGTYTVTLTNNAGCDSVATLNVIAKANTTSTRDTSVCPAQLPFTWNTKTISSGGTYTVTLTNNAGCDSVATLNVIAKPNTTNTRDTSVCPAQLPFTWNTKTISSGGTYTVTLTNNAGCDSV